MFFFNFFLYCSYIEKKSIVIRANKQPRSQKLMIALKFLKYLPTNEINGKRKQKVISQLNGELIFLWVRKVYPKKYYI